MSRLESVRHHALKSFGLNAVLVAAGTLAAVGLLEGLLHFYNPLGSRLRGDQIVLPVNRVYEVELEDPVKLDASIRHTKNSLGFRGPEPPPDFNDHLTVIAVGGSTTECFYLSDGMPWPAQLAARLASRFKPLWVNNAGLQGHSTFGHQFLLGRFLLDLRPDVLLFLVGINDIGLGERRRFDDSIDPGARRNWKYRLRGILLKTEIGVLGLNLYRYLQARDLRLTTGEMDFTAMAALPPDSAYEDSLFRRHELVYVPPYRARLAELVEKSRDAGILPVLMTQPMVYGHVVDPETGRDLGRLAVGGDARSSGTLWRLLELYNDATRAVAQRYGAPLIDLARLMPKNSRYFYDQVHFTNEGAAAVADLVAPELARILRDRFPAHAVAP